MEGRGGGSRGGYLSPEEFAGSRVRVRAASPLVSPRGSASNSPLPGPEASALQPGAPPSHLWSPDDRPPPSRAQRHHTPTETPLPVHILTLVKITTDLTPLGKLGPSEEIYSPLTESPLLHFTRLLHPTRNYSLSEPTPWGSPAPHLTLPRALDTGARNCTLARLLRQSCPTLLCPHKATR